MKIIYQNKWCRIVLKNNYYILQSKAKLPKYNDQYFVTSESAYLAIGIAKK
jgi:hypothetical protein